MSEYIVEEPNEHSASWRVHERIVRCRDCKHGRSPQQGLPWMCIRNCCAHIPIEPDGFCAWGELKERADG